MTTGREQYIIGVDLGGTNIVAGALTLDGTKHLAMRSIPTNSAAGDEAVAERIVGLVEGVFLDAISETGASRNDFVGIGVGAPGPLDRERGIVLVAPMDRGFRKLKSGTFSYVNTNRSSSSRYHMAPPA